MNKEYKKELMDNRIYYRGQGILTELHNNKKLFLSKNNK